MECNLREGQRVVFMGPMDDFDANIFKVFSRRGLKLPDSGKVYTVLRVFVSKCGAICIYLEEITNKGPGEPGFPAKYFKPLDETRLDVFRSLLAPVKRKETV